MSGTARDDLDNRLRAAGIDPPLAVRLAAYGELLLRANERTNLTGAGDAASLVPHIEDALSLVPDVEAQITRAHSLGRSTVLLVDVGSGGGLPAIPLALAVDGLRVVLIEPVRKKAAFLTTALRSLNIDGEVLAERAEVVGRDALYREQADCATARAVGRAPTVAELTLPLVRIGGEALLQRGATDPRERQALDDAASMLGAAVVAERVVGDNLRIFVVRKSAAIGQRFPRRNGVPEKRPLCLV